MIIKIKAVPAIMKSQSYMGSYRESKQAFLSRIVSNYNLSYSISRHGSCYMTFFTYREEMSGKEKRKFGIHLEKRNPVYKQVKFKNGRTKKTTLISAGYWIASIYSFPVDFPIEITQHSRHFTIKQSSTAL